MNKELNLVSTHGLVLFYIATNPDATMRQMSEALNLTERRIAQIVRDLADSDLLSVERCGRRNSYSVNPDASIRHPALAHIPLKKFVEIVKAPSVAVAAIGLGSVALSVLAYA